jgi:hypothetical protein
MPKPGSPFYARSQEEKFPPPVAFLEKPRQMSAAEYGALSPEQQRAYTRARIGWRWRPDLGKWVRG